MDISINDRPADITLDTEKNLGDVLSGIEQWISASGNRIRAVSVNGMDLGDSLSEAFSKDIREIDKLDITISSWRELAAEALADLRETCVFYENALFEERAGIAALWEQSAAARFLASDISDLYALADRSFSGEGLSAADLAVVTGERIREIADPRREIDGSESLVRAIAARMEELPLDIQTGKDARAAETVQHFARLGEKLFRMFAIFKTAGLTVDSFIIDGTPARIFIDEFNAVLEELSAAYENKDTVLVGDLAEYEMAPRLLKFFEALKNFSETQFRLPASPSVPSP